MVVQPQEVDKHELERFLLEKAEGLRYIISGLEHHDPFLRLIEMWKETERQLDTIWHKFSDPSKFNEARVTKFATDELVNILENLRADLVRTEIELEKLRHPEQYVNKDYEE